MKIGEPLMGYAIAALAGAFVREAPLPSLVVVSTWLLWFGRRATVVRSVVLVLGVLGMFVGTGVRAEGALGRYVEAHRSVARQLGGPRRCVFEALVETSPVLRTDVDQERGAAQNAVWTGRSSVLDCEGRRVSVADGVVLRLIGGPHDLARGDRVEVVAALAPTSAFYNAALPSPLGAAARRGALLSGSVLTLERVAAGASIRALVDRARSHVRARIMATYRPLSVSLGRALVLGESDLDPDEAVAFRQSGLLHLLAVSGTHLVIAVVSLVGALRAVLVRVGPLARRYDVARLSASLGLVASVAYADFAGGSGSAWRAAYMLGLVSLGRMFGRRILGAQALGASIVLGVVFDPLAGSDVSFLLSALATFGLILLGQPLARWLFGAPSLERVFAVPLARPLAESLAATLASSLPCAPLLATMDDQMTWVALFSNVVAGPLGELCALPACLLHAISSPLPALEQGLAMVGSGALVAVRAVALWSARADFAHFSVGLPSGLAIGAFATAFCGLSRLRELGAVGARSAVALVGVTLLGLGLTLRHVASLRHDAPPKTLVVTALDVGQGDALVVDFPGGQLALVDGGGVPGSTLDTGERVLLPYLRARGRERVELVVLSHAHPDHLLGLVTLAGKIPISELWMPAHPRTSFGPDAELVRRVRAQGGRVRTAPELCTPEGTSRHFGGVDIEVLWPCGPEASVGIGAGAPSVGAEPPLSENDGSLVLRLSYGRHRALLTGDIEQRAERALTSSDARRLRLGATLLKVAHHGSDTSSTGPFLQAVAAETALISTGVRNRFDHPRASTLLALAAVGARVLRTDRAGSVSWGTDGRKAWARAFHPR